MAPENVGHYAIIRP